MVNWFWRKRSPKVTLKLKSRGQLADGVTRVEFAELAPDLEIFLGQAAYLQLGYVETITRLIRATDDLGEKETLSQAAASALSKHHQLVELLRERGFDAEAAMAPHQRELDEFRWATLGAYPEETMLSVFITAGILDDFYIALALSYGELGEEIARVLAERDYRDGIVEILNRRIASDAKWEDMLSLWGRRLVADTILIARSALETDKRLDQEDHLRIEPIFTELMVAHSKRMDAMSLSA